MIDLNAGTIKEIEGLGITVEEVEAACGILAGNRIAAPYPDPWQKITMSKGGRKPPSTTPRPKDPPKPFDPRCKP